MGECLAERRLPPVTSVSPATRSYPMRTAALSPPLLLLLLLLRRRRNIEACLFRPYSPPSPHGSPEAHPHFAGKKYGGGRGRGRERGINFSRPPLLRTLTVVLPPYTEEDRIYSGYSTATGFGQKRGLRFQLFFPRPREGWGINFL